MQFVIYKLFNWGGGGISLSLSQDNWVSDRGFLHMIQGQQPTCDHEYSDTFVGSLRDLHLFLSGNLCLIYATSHPTFF
jgi:hypothetical protein